jgi:hypothetical protein
MQFVPLSTKKTKIAIVSLMIGGEDRFLELCFPLFSYIAPETAVGFCKGIVESEKPLRAFLELEAMLL